MTGVGGGEGGGGGGAGNQGWCHPLQRILQSPAPSTDSQELGEGVSGRGLGGSGRGLTPILKKQNKTKHTKKKKELVLLVSAPSFLCCSVRPSVRPSSVHLYILVEKKKSR